MIPEFDEAGNLPRGIHHATWSEITARFGGSPHRAALLQGLRSALQMFARAGCTAVYLNGSFVTAKPTPEDFDACWDSTGVDVPLLDLVIFDFTNGRAAQKAKYLGEFFRAERRESSSGSLFLEFFQVDKNSGKPKGIVAI